MAPTVRRLTETHDIDAALRVVMNAMGMNLDDAAVTQRRSRIAGSHFLGSCDPNGGGEIAGSARWYPSSVSVPGGVVAATAVSSVGVLATHRRRGHLRALMETLDAEARGQGFPLAVLVAAEWPIYGRFGYGPAVPIAEWKIDNRTARFVSEPVGHARYLTGAELRPLVDDLVARASAARPGVVSQLPPYMDSWCDLLDVPDAKRGEARFAVWEDPAGRIDGAMAYLVEGGDWVDRRPDSIATARTIVTSLLALRELTRLVCSLDWAATAVLDFRHPDDPLPFWFEDGRVAVAQGVSDFVWARVLDMAGVFGAWRLPIEAATVIEVSGNDPISGRWQLCVGPDGAEVERTDRAADVRLTPAGVGAVSLGGTSPRKLADGGWLEELATDGIARAERVLVAQPGPVNPFHF